MMGYTDLNDCFQQPIIEDQDGLDVKARETARRYLMEALEDIDNEMGAGYAAKNPEIVAAVLQVRARNFGTFFLVKNIQEGLASIGEELSMAGEALDGIMRDIEKIAFKLEETL